MLQEYWTNLRGHKYFFGLPLLFQTLLGAAIIMEDCIPSLLLRNLTQTLRHATFSICISMLILFIPPITFGWKTVWHFPKNAIWKHGLFFSSVLLLASNIIGSLFFGAEFVCTANDDIILAMVLTWLVFPIGVLLLSMCVLAGVWLKCIISKLGARD